jgi:hypothetical protein
MRRPLRLLPWRTSPRPGNGAGLPAPAVTRSEAEGEGLHKRSAEAWGNPLRARGAELPLAGAPALVFVL